MGFWPFRKATAGPTAPADYLPAPSLPRPSLDRAWAQSAMDTAKWHAFRSMQLAAAGDPAGAHGHLQDAGDWLETIGGPKDVANADEIYQWCAARQAGEI